MKEAVIVAAKRTAVGKVGGMFKHIPPEHLAAPLIQRMIEEYQLDPESIDEVILGNAVGPGGNLARLTALTAGLPVSIPGVTVDRQCGSGLEAVNLAARLVQAGAGDIYLAGGVESTSLAPWKMEKPSSLYHPRGPKLFTRARFSPDEVGDPEMGIAAENVAEAYGISRVTQDQYAYNSHVKAIRAIESGYFSEEIVPIEGMTNDECPRKQTSIVKLNALPPVFKENGTVTAGNACPINDGASIILIMSREKCLELGLTPILRFVDAVSSGVDPNVLGIAPVPAVTKLLKRQHLSIEDIDIVEFNEAFASQVLASLQELQIPVEKVNRGGGALAIGHPYGASGAILITRLCTEMKRHHLKRGIATLGIGGGLGLATLVELIE
ncbi:thiolase family protein [Halalkalibacter nanhaiisediminis]|uniref:Acetyl-CoA C-acetyltransferase n=1 Tax=Halalkalibacter nanhaiisediminis TaxID=688079 RepID=A0A562QD54_9BACI|nr:thiolase family protein [Halalkalibacter nanhaiisediminis]TWI54695.1 acetyl-CoA C-acetyltransferase [Halalkalibacter nanhaiisediminis]